MIKKIKKYFQSYKKKRLQLTQENRDLYEQIKKHILIIKMVENNKFVEET